MAIWRSVVSITHASLGGTGSNTFHFRTTTGAADVEIQSQLDGAAASLLEFYDDMETIFPTETTLSHSGLWQEVVEEDPRLVATAPWTMGGGGGSSVAPPFVCLVIGWRTALSSRRGRGRTFLGPIAGPVVQDNGTPVEAGRSTVESAAATWIATFSGATDGAFCIYSEVDETGRDIISGLTRNEFAYLSSRRD